MRRIPSILLPIILAASARAQSSMSACGPRPDSSARQVIKMSGGVRVCLLAAQLTSGDDLPRDWAARARTLILETQRDGDNRRAALSGISVTWTVNGQAAPQDSLADAWQKAVVDYVDAAFQADEFRRQVAALHAEIDSLPERILAAKARISYLEGRDRQLNVEILNARNDPRRVEAAQEELRALQPRQSITLLKLQIANYESVNASDIEREIKALDAPQRLPGLDAQVEKTRLALLAVLEARGKAPSW